MDIEDSAYIVDRCCKRRMMKEDVDIAWSTQVPTEVETIEDPDENLSIEGRYVIELANRLSSSVEEIKGLTRELDQYGWFVQNGENQYTVTELLSIINIANSIKEILQQQREVIDMNNQDEIVVIDDEEANDSEPQMMYGDIML